MAYYTYDTIISYKDRDTNHIMGSVNRIYRNPEAANGLGVDFCEPVTFDVNTCGTITLKKGNKLYKGRLVKHGHKAIVEAVKALCKASNQEWEQYCIV